MNNLVPLIGKSHYTKKEMQEKIKDAIHQTTFKNDNIKPPDFLPESLHKEFWELVEELAVVQGTISNLDCNTLGMYVMAKNEYAKVSQALAGVPVEQFKVYDDMTKTLARLHKQVMEISREFGLTTRSRSQIQPAVIIEKVEKKQNKFDGFTP